jgi:hypothetical protein
MNRKVKKKNNGTHLDLMRVKASRPRVLMLILTDVALPFIFFVKGHLALHFKHVGRHVLIIPFFTFLWFSFSDFSSFFLIFYFLFSNTFSFILFGL